MYERRLIVVRICDMIRKNTNNSSVLLVIAAARSAPQVVSDSETTYEMARDEARHGKAFEGLLKRYFG